MAKRRREYKSSKCPEPINTMLDLAGALTLGLYTKHKIKKDFEKGEGEVSAKAAGMVFGIGSMRGGSRGIINLGGLIGLNSALKAMDREQKALYIPAEPTFVDKVSDAPKATFPQVKKYLWRNYCEDGSPYDINPSDYETADEYSDALANAKKNTNVESDSNQATTIATCEYQDTSSKKYIWRKYCEDGFIYGINPMNYETADEYEDALLEAKDRK